MAHAVRVGVGERFERPPFLFGHGFVKGAEVAHVDFVDGNVLRADQGRFRQSLPTGRLPIGVIQIENLAARAVHGQADGVGVGDDVVLHLAGTVDVDFHFVQVVLPFPASITHK